MGNGGPPVQGNLAARDRPEYGEEIADRDAGPELDGADPDLAELTRQIAQGLEIGIGLHPLDQELDGSHLEGQAVALDQRRGQEALQSAQTRDDHRVAVGEHAQALHRAGQPEQQVG